MKKSISNGIPQAETGSYVCLPCQIHPADRAMAMPASRMPVIVYTADVVILCKKRFPVSTPAKAKRMPVATRSASPVMYRASAPALPAIRKT